ncbi:MAG: hypothetical protein LUC44_01690 [Prevotellaceae bacterium]|nr:hypothetical protein [Prevotellaceae bacterium]
MNSKALSEAKVGGYAYWGYVRMGFVAFRKRSELRMALANGVLMSYMEHWALMIVCVWHGRNGTKREKREKVRGKRVLFVKDIE